jgi:hypothetical protein
VRVYEKRVLRRIFGPKREEVEGGRRELQNEGFIYSYMHFPPHIIKVIKPRWIRWVEHVARIGDVRNAYRNLI